MQLLFITSGTLPMPPTSGGAVETLLDLILKNNEVSGRYGITVCSVYSSVAEQQIARYCHTRFFYVQNQGAADFLERAVRHSVNQIPGVYIGNLYLSKILKYFGSSIKDYDAVIVENAPVYGLLLKKFAPKRLILHLHNDLLNPEVKMAREVYDSFDEIYTLSDYIHRRVDQIATTSKVKTLYNGVDLQKFHIDPARRRKEEIKRRYGVPGTGTVVLYAGRLVPEKGVRELLQAFGGLPAGGNITLVIAGSPVYGENVSGPYVDELHKIADECGNPVRFTGYIAQSRMPELYSMADFVVIPSIWEEPFALTVVEAMAAGLPVVISDSGGMTEIVDAGSAVVVHRGDRFVGELRTAIRNLAQDGALREAMAANAFRRALRFDKGAYLERFDRLLDRSSTDKGE